MDERQFRQLALEQGYGDFQFKAYPSHNDGPLHTHAFSVMLLVTEGHFSLAFEDSATDYRPGEVCELTAGTMHTERTGPEGANVLLAKRSAVIQSAAA